jgi:hypothetical protein
MPFLLRLEHRLSATQVQDIALRLLAHEGLRLQSDGQFHQNGTTVEDAVAELRARDGVEHLFMPEGDDTQLRVGGSEPKISALARLKQANRARGR